MTGYLKNLILQDLANAEDNLARAKAAAKRYDPTKLYGQSGQTLNEIIAGYERWRDEALSALGDEK